MANKSRSSCTQGHTSKDHKHWYSSPLKKVSFLEIFIVGCLTLRRVRPIGETVQHWWDYSDKGKSEY